MKKFVAIAPVVKLDNLKGKLIQSVKENKTVLSAVESLGPELFTMGSMENPIVNGVLSNSLGVSGGKAVLKEMTDSDPNYVSQKGFLNLVKFFPAGTSFNTLEHLR